MLLKLFLFFYIRINAYLLWLAIVLINPTLKIKIENEQIFQKLKKQKIPTVFVFWHQASFAPLYYYRHEKVYIFTAKSLRGEILTWVAKKLGYKVVRISEDEKSTDRIRSLITVLGYMKKGYSVCVAVDGPTGPLFKMKPGPVFLASKSQSPILPLAVAATKPFTMSWRWDKYFMPKPFSTVMAKFGDPIRVGEKLTTEQLEEERQAAEAELVKLTKEIKAKAGQLT